MARREIGPLRPGHDLDAFGRIDRGRLDRRSGRARASSCARPRGTRAGRPTRGSPRRPRPRVVSSMTQPRSCTQLGDLAVERRADARPAMLGQDECLAGARPRRRVPADVGERRRRRPRRPSTRRTTPCPRPGASSRRSRRRCRHGPAGRGRAVRASARARRRRSP